MPDSVTDIPSPEQGLLCAYQLDGNGLGESITINSQADQSATGGFRWFHFQCDLAETTTSMVRLGLSEAVIDSLSAIETRPRSMDLDSGILVILRGVNKNPGAEADDMVALRIWFTQDLVITSRRHNRMLKSVADMRRNIEHGSGPKSPGEFIVMLATRLADHINDTVDDIDDELTNIETHIADMSTRETRSRLTDTRRQTATLRRYLAPQRDAMDMLFRLRGVITDQDAFILREQTDRTTRYVEDLDLARERTLVLQEELRNQLAEQQNMKMYILAIVAAIFLPLSFLTGVFGMNVAGLPGLENPMAFTYLAAGMVTLAVLLVGIMRWLKWF